MIPAAAARNAPPSVKGRAQDWVKGRAKAEHGPSLLVEEAAVRGRPLALLVLQSVASLVATQVLVALTIP